MMWRNAEKTEEHPREASAQDRGQRAVHYGQRPHSGAKWILHSPRSILIRGQFSDGDVPSHGLLRNGEALCCSVCISGSASATWQD